MFIKQLYHYNKYWLAVFLCFILFFFYINYKWGVVATPVYQYGMFSGKYSVKDTLSVYRFYVDDKELNPAAMHFTKRDMLFTMTEKYFFIQKNPMLVYETMKTVFSRIGLGKLVSEDKYRQNITDSGFAKWLLGYSKEKGKKLEILLQQYRWEQNSMKPISVTQSIIFETN